MKYLPLIWAGLWRRKARTVLTLLSIVVAFLLFGLLQGVDNAFSQGIDNANVDRMVVTNSIALTEPLPLAYLQQIQSLPGVKAAAHASWFGSYYQDRKNQIFGSPVDIEGYLKVSPEMKVDAAAVDRMLHTRDGALVGETAMKKYGWKIGDRIPITSEIWTRSSDGSSNWEFEIVGTYTVGSDANSGNSFVFNYDYFDEARAFRKGYVGWYVITIADPSQSADVAKRLDALFANSPYETKTQTEKEFSQSFIKQFGDINFLVNAILGAVFFTLLFLTGNTMMQSVRERIPELAVLKTLGFGNGQVLGFVLAEALFLCLLAAALGLAASWAMFPALKQVVGDARLPPDIVLSGFATAVLLALLIGTPPALRALRLNIVDALAGR
jgi:putative ABC transport system permease protein